MFLKSRDTTSSAEAGPDVMNDEDIDDSVVVPIPSLTAVNPNALPWVEKYRPKKLADVSHQPQAIAALKSAIVSANLPHLLLYGPAGTGKTSTILALARELFGPELAAKRVLELNASDERGIDVIRVKVKEFAGLAVSSRDPKSPYPQPPFKLIILDECDSLTKDAQSALRRTMEQYTKVTRFCLICNYVSRLIEPVQSRCTRFRYTPIHRDAMIDRLQFIADSEHLSFPAQNSRQVLDQIAARSEGDLRQAITFMQSVARQTSNVMSLEAITAASTAVPENVIDSLENAVKSPAFEAISQCVTMMRAEGYDTIMALQQWMQRLIATEKFTPEISATILLAISQCEARLMDGADESIQLTHVLAKANNELKKANLANVRDDIVVL